MAKVRLVFKAKVIRVSDVQTTQEWTSTRDGVVHPETKYRELLLGFQGGVRAMVRVDHDASIVDDKSKLRPVAVGDVVGARGLPDIFQIYRVSLEAAPGEDLG